MKENNQSRRRYWPLLGLSALALHCGDSGHDLGKLVDGAAGGARDAFVPDQSLASGGAGANGGAVASGGAVGMGGAGTAGVTSVGGGTGGKGMTGGTVPGVGGNAAGSGGSVVGAGGTGGVGGSGGGTMSTGGNGGGAVGTGGGQGGSGQGGSTRSDAGFDAPTDTNQPDCPSSVPSGSCSLSSSSICYYGDDSRWFCKTSAKCSQGSWQVTLPMSECTAPADPSCPTDPASPPASTCSADGGTRATCVYATEFCKCNFMTGADPRAGWYCSMKLPAECPSLPPGDGSPCTLPSGVWCTYGLPCNSTTQCVEGKWVTMLLAC